jgi:hypothetical protein
MQRSGTLDGSVQGGGRDGGFSTEIFYGWGGDLRWDAPSESTEAMFLIEDFGFGLVASCVLYLCSEVDAGWLRMGVPLLS